MATNNLLRHRDIVGSTLLRDFQQHQADHAHELRDMPAKLPLLADRKARNVTREINLNAIQVVAHRQLAQERHLVLAQSRCGEIPHALGPP